MISIILSTCLIMVIGILGCSIQDMEVKNAIRESGGNYHGIYGGVTENEINILKNNRNVEKAGEVIPFTSVDPKDKSQPQIDLSYFDSNAASMISMKIKKGHMPKASNEIAIENWVLDKVKAEHKIGSKVHLDCGDFVLSGILQDNEINKKMHNYTQAAVSKPLVLKNVKNVKALAYVRIKSGRKLKSAVLNLGSHIGVSEKNIKVNDSYIEASGGDLSLIIVFACIGFIVLIATAMVIYNIFYISVSERIRQFGLLKALGATKGQIRKLIFREGIFLSVFGIPIGVVLGYVLSFIVIPLFSDKNLKVVSSPYIALISILVSLFTISLSLRKPQKLASRISPIEAIRYTGIKASDKKERKSFKKISISKMAYLNLWRNKKSTIMTILSISLSGILFLTLLIVFKSMDINNQLNQDLKYEFSIYSMDAKQDVGNLIGKIKNIDGVTKINTEIIGDFDTVPENSSIHSNGLYGYSDDILNSLKKHLVSGKISIQDLKNKNDVLIAYNNEDGECKYKAGDKINLDIKKIEKGKTTVLKRQFVVAGILDRNFQNNSEGKNCYSFIVHNNTFTRTTGVKSIYEIYISINEKKRLSIERKIKDLISTNSDFDCESYTRMADKTKKQNAGIEIFSMSLIAIVGIIGLMNFINTMITSVFARKNEIGILQAVGLSNSQLRKMLQIEGMYYALISAAVASVFGSLLGYLFYKLLKSVVSYAKYQIPIVPIIALTFILVLVQILVSMVVNISLGKESIIDRIRYSE